MSDLSNKVVVVTGALGAIEEDDALGIVGQQEGDLRGEVARAAGDEVFALHVGIIG